jgi:ribose transport system permease protein
LAGTGFTLAIVSALLAALAVGTLNALLIGVVGIAPFLATLGTLFIGQSVQQLASDGGQTIYLMNLRLPASVGFIAHGSVLGVPMPVWLVVICLFGLWTITERTLFGQRITALGLQPGAARLSGLPVRRDTILVYILAAGCCAVTGVLLSCTVKSYAPGAGGAYVLDAIGATFIGTTFHPGHRASIVGTSLGVLMLSTVADGLVLVGWNFEWQQVASGLLVLAILAISFGTARSRT